jgi:hypothetical protein
MFSQIHDLLVSLLGLSYISLLSPSLMLSADRSDIASSGYMADNSRSVSSTIPAGEEKFQFGALVNGMSYNEVSAVRNQVYLIMVQGSKDSRVVTVSDVLNRSSNNNTRKVLEKAYSISNIPYDSGQVLAMKNISENHSVNFSPAAQALLDMR